MFVSIKLILFWIISFWFVNTSPSEIIPSCNKLAETLDTFSVFVLSIILSVIATESQFES